MTAFCDGGTSLGFDYFSEASRPFSLWHLLALNHSTFIVHRPPSRYGVLDLEQWLMNEAMVSAHFLYGTTVSPLAFDPNLLSAKSQTEISNLWTTGLHRSSAALKRPGRINPGTCATDWRASPLWRDCVTQIKGKQRQCFRRSPHRLKDNSDDSSAFLINEASLAFPVSSFANIWAQKDSKKKHKWALCWCWNERTKSSVQQYSAATKIKSCTEGSPLSIY